MKISTHYQEELKILNSILSENAFLIQMLYEIKKYKKDKEELQQLDKEYKETQNENVYLKFLGIEQEVKRDKFNIFDVFNNIIESITK